MYISWYGESCFKIQNSDKTILIDPEAPRKAGLRGPNFSAKGGSAEGGKSNLVLLSNREEEKEIKKKIGEASFLIAGPGEYEIKGVFIEGIPAGKEKKQTVIYRIVFEEVSFGFLGLGVDCLEDEQIEKIGVIDVLFAPVSERVEEIINSIEPKIVIPHSYQVPGLKVKRETKEKFLKKLGKKDIKALEKFSLNKRDLLRDSIQEEVIILEART